MTRRRALGAVRLLFVLATAGLAGWGFRGRWGEIGAAMTTTGPLRLVGAVACAAAGLVCTSLLWRLLLRGVDSEVGVRDAASIFFVGQLGKYVPGSVWNIVVQAQLGRRHDVPPRSSAAASLLFLIVHTATGLALGASLVLLGALDLPAGVDPVWACAALAAGGVALAPSLLRRVAGRLAGPGVPVVLGAPELGRSIILMGAVWVLYGGSMLLLAPSGAGSPDLLAATAAFALAHAAGVLFVVAPAGVGAREAVLVALLSPVLGAAGAVAAALLSRVAHSLADFLVAAAAAAWVRAARPVRAVESGAAR